MSKVIRIKETGSLGFDLSAIEIYHTSITASNLLTTVTASIFDDPEGILVTDIPDDYTTFFGKCISGPCNGTTQSLAVISNAQPSTIYYQVYAGGSLSSVSAITPVTVPSTTGSFIEGINFNDVPLFTISASPVDTEIFDGWYTQESGGTQLSTNSSLSITEGDFPGTTELYAQFSKKAYTYTLIATDGVANGSVGTPLTRTVTGIPGTIHTVNYDITAESQYTLTIAADESSADVTTAVSSLSGNNKRVTATVTMPVNGGSAGIDITGTSVFVPLPTFVWSGGVSVSQAGAISVNNGNVGSVSTSPTSFSIVNVNTTRSIQCTYTIPSGYANAGTSETVTKTATQALTPTFTFSNWTGTFTGVSQPGTISYTTGNAAGVTTTPTSYPAATFNTNRTPTFNITVPSGYYNSSQVVSGTKGTQTQPGLTVFTFSDWTGTFDSVSQNGTINYTTGNAAGVSIDPASYGIVNVNNDRTPTFTITVPAGHNNTGGTVSGTKGTRTQPATPTFTFSDWTGTFTSVDQDGTINYTNGNASSVSVSPTSYSVVNWDANRDRTPTFTVTVPSGYYNAGATVSGTKGTEQQPWTYLTPSVNSFSVAVQGSDEIEILWNTINNANSATITWGTGASYTNVGSHTVTNFGDGSHNAEGLTGSTTYNFRMVASNPGIIDEIIGEDDGTTETDLVNFTFSDWTGDAAVAANGDISFTNGNATSVTNSPSQTFTATSIPISRTVNCLVTVPSGYLNSGNTVSGTKSATQSISTGDFSNAETLVSHDESTAETTTFTVTANGPWTISPNSLYEGHVTVSPSSGGATAGTSVDISYDGNAAGDNNIQFVVLYVNGLQCSSFEYEINVDG